MEGIKPHPSVPLLFCFLFLESDSLIFTLFSAAPVIILGRFAK